MTYPAIVTTVGDHTVAEFPDCPGCQTFARGPEDIVQLAQDALEGWLELALDDGDVPPKPSDQPPVPEGGTIIRVPVSSELELELERAWRRA